MENKNPSIDGDQSPMKPLHGEPEASSNRFRLPPWLSGISQFPPAPRLSSVVGQALKEPAWARRLDHKYSQLSHCEMRLRNDRMLSKTLNECTDTLFWEPLLNLPILQVQEHSRGIPAEYADPVVRAFRAEYLGDAHTVLLKAIDEMKSDSRRQYARILPVVQSSGMGKSKMIDKVAQQRILIPMCLRVRDAPLSLSYPPPDMEVRNYLLGKAPGTTNPNACKTFWRGFLASLYQCTQNHLQYFNEQGICSYEEMAATFYQLFTTEIERNAFYKEVVSKASEHADIDAVALDPVLQSLENDLKQLKCLPNGFSILVAIDEVHSLYERRIGDQYTDYNLFSSLKSVLSELVSRDCCTIVLTTTMVASKIAPTKSVSPSLYERIGDMDLLAPYTELPFDVHILEEPLVQDKLTLESVGSVKFTAKFGRPLWYSAYKSKINSQPNKGGRWTSFDTIELIRTVRLKLSGHISLKSPPDFNASSLAVLSARIFLEFSPKTSLARIYEQEQVQTHLRVVYSVHRNREVMVTGSSSEPLVAEAAAGLMNISDVWGLLEKFVDRGLAAQGNIGGLIGRAITIGTMDRAINGLKNHCELKYQTPVPVTTYYKALLTEDAWEKLRKSVPANQRSLIGESATKTFEQAFKHAYFHFSHYGKAIDATPLTKGYAWALWLRGAAILCPPDQALVDRGMPIFFSNYGTVSAKSISWNLDQDKTSPDASPGIIPNQTAEKLNLFENEMGLPYISAVHCYKCQQDEGIVTMQPSVYKLGDTVTTQAPHYQIVLHGLEAYGGLDGSIKDRIHAIIDASSRFIYKWHPYGQSDLNQMQPLLNQDQDNTAWFGGFHSDY